jgi:glycosyltransferase involved in cell wall biosynthesis
MQEPIISIVIPNRNGSATIGRCLQAACAARDARSEIIVVDDGSTDGSVEIIRQYPCTLVCLDQHAGAGAARNAGARNATGDYLFFIDADCLLLEHTLAAVRVAIRQHADAVIGGTYTMVPADRDFFSSFQSVFIHYHETRRHEPDYIASHALLIRTETFRAAGGFPERFLPIIEDVALSHRLRLEGRQLVMAPDILVRHIFNFSLRRSLANAFRKSRYWTIYSLHSGDALSDSGTASRGLKVNVAAFLVSALSALTAVAAGRVVLAAGAALPVLAAVAANRGLLRAFRQARGGSFAIFATLYYLFLYPAAVAAGAMTGIAQHVTHPRLPGIERARP